MPLVALTYVSTARVEWGMPDFERIRRSSERHNARMDITALLAYATSSFLHLIEGEERAVINVFNRIEQDPRHSEITVIDWRFTVDRFFGEWRMAVCRLGQADADAHPVLAPHFERGFDPYALAARPELAHDILMVAAQRVRRACQAG